MKRLFSKEIFIIGLLLSAFFSNTYGTNPKLNEMLEISEIKINSYDEAGNTAVIEFKVTALETFNGTLKFRAPNSVSDTELQTRTEGISLSKQSSETHTVSIKLPENEVSYISLSISVPTAPEGYKQEYYRYFKLIKTGRDVTILDPREESQLKPKEVGKEINIITETESPLGPESLYYTVNISGRIIVDQLDGEGLFGNGVRLWFRNSANPGTWYHPIINNQLNVTYDLLDEQGNFNFNFSFTGDLSGYNQAIIIINTANDAAYLPAPPDGYISWGPHGYTYYFNESEGVIASINGSSSNITVNQNGDINKEDGSILRYMQLAREFTIQRYNGNPPFSIPQIQTFNEETNPEVGGFFHVGGSTHYIVIDPDGAEMATITHEYGHYINYRMWSNNNTHWFLASDDLLEGWAIFYCFAARSYINKMYGDNINSFDDNTEYSPFYIGSTQYGNIRYANIRYVWGRNEPMKAACACNIWNLYDSYDGGNFEMNTYAGDNDDVSGYGTLVFESMRSLNQFNSTVSGIHFAFYNAVPTELRQSVVDINFFMYDNLTTIPSHKMKSSQIINPGLTNISPTQIRLNWSTQSYSGSYTEVNAPTQYRVYKNVNGTYQLFASSSFGTNNVDIPLAGSSGQYKFTAYNSSGDSYGVIEKQIFNVSLATAIYLEPGSGGFYKINGTNMGATWSGAYLSGMSPITLEAVPPSGYFFSKWSDGSTFNPRQVSSGDINVYAVYKGLQLSNNLDAYSSNGQRKAVRLESTNYLLSVYKSSNNVWLEQSTNNGQSWFLKTAGTPLDNDPYNQYSTPAIDYIPSLGGSHPFAAIVHNLVKLSIIRTNVNIPHYSQFIPVNFGPSATYITPVVATTSNKILVVYNGGMNSSNQEGLAFVFGSISFVNNNITVSWTDGQSPYKIIPGTSQYSKNPTIVANKSAGNVFHIAWEELNNIKYCKATISGNTLSFSSSENASASSGYSSNLNPSISLANGYPIISWTVGGMPIDDKIIAKENAVNPPKAIIRRKGTSWGDIQVVGNNVNYTNNNSVTSATEKTVIVYSEGSTPLSKWIKRTGSTYITPQTLSHSGIQTQVIHGSDYQYMTSLVFKNNSLPYYFKKSTTNFNYNPPPQKMFSKKSESDTILTFGRSGIVDINGIEFVFNIGDIIVEDSIIGFIEKPDTLLYSSFSDLNQWTRTENFDLTPNSLFYFSNFYQVVQKSNADTALTDTDAINFKAELVNASTGEVIGTFDNITYSMNSLAKYASIDYEVDCSGIAQGDYYLRLATTVIGEAAYSLANVMNDNTQLSKKNFTKIGYTGTEQPVTYELYQNFPNPFNPSTAIRYQVPEDGIVSLKIYDILGKEVTTLVNDHKSVGKYEISFDASNFASGVYIYRIQVNNFVSSKKMMLLK